MNPLFRILAATDLSAPARQAVDHGFYIAAESQSDVLVVSDA